MDLSIRSIAEDEFTSYLHAVEGAFSSVPSEEDIAAERSLAELDRCLAAFDGDAIVGTAAAFTMPMTVPGGDVSVPFVTAVGVSQTHRRRGVNTALMRRQLDDARDRGEPIAVLFASEGGIYGRYGYGLATFGLSFSIEVTRTEFVRGYAPSGTVRLMEADAATDIALEVHGRVCPDVPGMVELDRARFPYTLRDHGPDKDLPKFFAIHDGQEGPDGFAIYRVRRDWRDGVPSSTLTLLDLQATSAGAYADLWRYVLDVDLIARLEAWGRAVDEPLLHLLAEPRRLRAKLVDGLWLRLVDVAVALEARRYPVPGRLVIEVTDAFCPWNEGRYLLEIAKDGVARCGPTSDPPDVACSASELGASYLGSRFDTLHRAGLVDERTAGAVARAESMFGWHRAPWAPYDF